MGYQRDMPVFKGDVSARCSSVNAAHPARLLPTITMKEHLMLDRIKPIATCAMLMGALGTAPVYAQDTASEDAPTADTVVATVDGTEITLGHMLILRAGLPQQFQQVPA